jgi:hypothetical protein
MSLLNNQGAVWGKTLIDKEESAEEAWHGAAVHHCTASARTLEHQGKCLLQDCHRQVEQI